MKALKFLLILVSVFGSLAWAVYLFGDMLLAGNPLAAIPAMLGVYTIYKLTRLVIWLSRQDPDKLDGFSNALRNVLLIAKLMAAKDKESFEKVIKLISLDEDEFLKRVMN